MENNNEEDMHVSTQLKGQLEKETEINEKEKDANLSLNVCEEQNKNDIESQVLKSKEMSPLTNIKESANLFAEHIAKEAKIKATEIISKNDRVQQEYSGIGLNTNQQNSYENCIHINKDYDYLNNSEDNNENEEILTENHPKKKILIGAKAVIPTGDKELLEKLKQRKI
ncbi:conserved Plasmodium protein, unknown function [Plasmodium relictum]|uniref:Uncharacterized protein n=1 Tax=Plasmodium relictum TaxID=85471 RepID=A0A1J1H2L8_PLARL|nr:conserved Plasmodium protein, unknown function [Plasmodium relictum]CRG99147.1 conserved Plasmodium protein, unknown function [Plasmodium relictum]